MVADWLGLARSALEPAHRLVGVRPAFCTSTSCSWRMESSTAPSTMTTTTTGTSATTGTSSVTTTAVVVVFNAAV
jgi:hypothetical protein